MHVFTYGTLMFPDVWRAVAGREFASVPAHANGFAIYRVRNAVFPGIIAATPQDAVPGVVYLDVDEATIERLDRFEDDFYRRQAVDVRCSDGRVLQADAYVVPAGQRDVLTDEPWLAAEFVARGDLERFVAGFAGFGRL